MELKIQQTSEYNNKEAGSQVKRTNQWLPVGRRKGGGQYRGLRGTNY